MPNEHLDRLNKMTGLDGYFLSSNEKTISSDEQSPTIFTGLTRQFIPAGATIFDMATGTEQITGEAIDITADVSAAGSRKGNRFLGRFETKSRIIVAGSEMHLDMWGEFEIELMVDSRSEV